MWPDDVVNDPDEVNRPGAAPRQGLAPQRRQRVIGVAGRGGDEAADVDRTRRVRENREGVDDLQGEPVEPVEGPGHRGASGGARGELPDVDGDRDDEVRTGPEKVRELVVGTGAQVVGERARGRGACGHPLYGTACAPRPGWSDLAEPLEELGASLGELLAGLGVGVLELRGDLGISRDLIGFASFYRHGREATGPNPIGKPGQLTAFRCPPAPVAGCRR